jgi:AraC family transcriptional regulator
VTGPHLYEFGELPIPTVAITLHDVRRHGLIENGQVRRDAPVHAGDFRIGQPGRSVVVVDAVPEIGSGKLLLLLYLGEALLKEVGASRGLTDPITLMDLAWDTEDPLPQMSAQRLVEASDSGHRPNALLAEQVAYTLALHLSDRYAAPGSPKSERLPTLDETMRTRIAEFVRADLRRLGFPVIG